MASDQSTTPLELDLNVRKRVCKACDRCRLKKSKCDGTTPCSRCKSDNAICIFGERKKTHDKVYPKGYVEMLEHQQTQLVNGLQELYKIATSDQGWEGPLLADGGNGRPLTHDILHSLGVLHSESQSASTLFDEDLDTLQQRLISDGADMVHPRESPDSDYEKVPTQVTFDVGRQQRPTYRNPFAISQLPTPPMLSPSDAQSAQEFMWQTSVKPAQIRSQSLQIHPGHLAWGGVSMNPAILQSRAWAESPLPYEASSDSLGGEGLAHFVNMDVGQQQVALAGEATMPDWIEDDYVSFLDTPLS